MNTVQNENQAVVLLISDAAAVKVKRLMQEENNLQLCLRVLVTPQGCQGLKYGFAFDETTDIDVETDTVFDTKGIRLVVDTDILVTYLKGSTIDYQDDFGHERFIIDNNPNAASSCGCGVSFCEKREDNGGC